MTLKIMRDSHRLALLGALIAASVYSQQPYQPPQRQPIPPRAPVGVTRNLAPNATPGAKAGQSPAARYSPLASLLPSRRAIASWPSCRESSAGRRRARSPPPRFPRAPPPSRHRHLTIRRAVPRRPLRFWPTCSRGERGSQRIIYSSITGATSCHGWASGRF